MIVVEVNENGITVTGHAGYAEPGKDIVCAAVSVLVQNLITCLYNFTNDLGDCTAEPGKAIIKYKSLSEQGKLLVDSFFIGICQIQESYGSQYVQVR